MPEDKEKSLLSQIHEKEEELKHRLTAEQELSAKRLKEAGIKARNIIQRAYIEGEEAAAAFHREKLEEFARERDRLLADGEVAAERMKEKGMANFERAVDLIIRSVAPGGRDAAEDEKGPDRRTT